MAEAIDVRPVATKREMEQFIRLPWSLYGSDPHWVPPLLSAMRKLLDPEQNPFFEHAEATYYLAWQYGRPVGRIAAIVNFLHNSYQGETTGFWGFFESERDPKIFRALFDRAAADLRDHGMTHVRIETLEQNEVAQHLYPKLGFREIAHQIHYMMEIPSADKPA